MRIEATVPESRGSAVVQLAEELGMSRSQLVDEALALFLKAVVEVKRGRRLVLIDPSSSSPACELATPTLSALEWAQNPQPLLLSPEEIAKIEEIRASPPAPSARLRAAMKRHQ